MSLKTLSKVRRTTLYRGLSLAFASLLVISSLVAGTLAMSLPFQHRSNEFDGLGSGSVILQKYEREPGGDFTENPIPDAQFLLFRVNPDGPSTQLGGIFTTDSDGQIRVSDLLPGEYYFYELLPAPGYLFDRDEQGEEIRRFFFTIWEEDFGRAVVVFAYNIPITGELEIEKTVANDDGSALTPEQLEMEFEFVVTFSDEGTYAFTIYEGTPLEAIGEEEYLESGDSLFLRHGQVAIFRHIPVGVVYTVTEVPVPGFIISSNYHQGTITDDEGRRATFVNLWREPYEGGYGSLIVSKEVRGIVSDTEFTFTAVIGGETFVFTLRHGQEWRRDGIPVGTEFTVTETPVEGYAPNFLHYSGVIAVRDVVVRLPFVNVWDQYLEDEYGSLEVRKAVPGGSESRFDFRVTFGNLPEYPVTILMNGAPVTLSNTNYQFDFQLGHNQVMRFEGIPHGVTYRVVETVAEGYIASILVIHGIIVGDEVAIAQFTNHPDPREPEEVEITLEKVVEGESYDANTRFTFLLEVEGEDPIVFFLYSGGRRTFTVPYGVMYTFTEVNIPDGFTLLGITDGHGTTRYGILAVATNLYEEEEETLDIEGEKTWVVDPEVPADEVIFPDFIIIQLLQNGRVIREQVVRPDPEGDWHFIFENLPKYDDNEEEFEYTIREVPVFGWTSSYEDFDVVNEWTGDPYTDVFVRKVWNDGNHTDRPSSVLIQLYRDGEPYGEPILVNGAMGWSYTWRNLEVGPAWTVSEVNVPEGYTDVVTGNADSGFTITNTLEEPYGRGETVVIEGSKTWHHGTNPVANRPTQITVILLANGEPYLRFNVSATQRWGWSIEVDKYDDEGNEIVWTIDEEYVAGYIKTINGHNITNTHVSVGDDEDPDRRPGDDDRRPDTGRDRDIPKTGDESNLRFWVMLMVFGAIGMAATWQLARWDKNNRED